MWWEQVLRMTPSGQEDAIWDSGSSRYDDIAVILVFSIPKLTLSFEHKHRSKLATLVMAILPSLHSTNTQSNLLSSNESCPLFWKEVQILLAMAPAAEASLSPNPENASKDPSLLRSRVLPTPPVLAWLKTSESALGFNIFTIELIDPSLTSLHWFYAPTSE